MRRYVEKDRRGNLTLIEVKHPAVDVGVMPGRELKQIKASDVEWKQLHEQLQTGNLDFDTVKEVTEEQN